MEYLSHIRILSAIIPAYIDPGTGSLLLQLLLGGIASGWVVLKLFGKRIMARFGSSKKEKDQD
ncbi:MAG: hypothetical protein HZB59_04390 [Ignavibacteriales bacterium]|nr:hypothetical protein [Ignavibacteriales bacterium]